VERASHCSPGSSHRMGFSGDRRGRQGGEEYWKKPQKAFAPFQEELALVEATKERSAASARPSRRNLAALVCSRSGRPITLVAPVSALVTTLSNSRHQQRAHSHVRFAVALANSFPRSPPKPRCPTRSHLRCMMVLARALPPHRSFAFPAASREWRPSPCYNSEGTQATFRSPTSAWRRMTRV